MTGQTLIPLKQVLAEMQAATEPFSVRFVKLNEGKGTGGEIVEYPAMLLSGRREAGEKSSVVEGEGSPVAEATSEAKVPTKSTRDPHHSDHMTRNLINNLNGRYAKVHIYLLLEFNGKKVLI